MRLIDADALLKVFGFTEDCKKCEHRYNDMLCESVIWRDVCDAIFEAPTIDAVPVVRCKDCIYYQDNNGGYPNADCKWCKDETPDANDYCSCGERNEKAKGEY